MISHVIVPSILAVAMTVEARFGQEQLPIAAINALSNLGSPGQAATLAGGDISTLLAAANPCAKLQAGDAILEKLGTSDAAIAAARGLVGAEQNFNPFVVSVPNICNDVGLPANPLLRGVVPLVDPAVVGSSTENTNAKMSLTTPFTADGLSVAQVMTQQGFSNFTTTALDGTKGPAPAVSDAGNATANSTATIAPSVADSSQPSPPAAAAGPPPAAAGNSSITKSTIASLDFGLCVPTMKFEAGLNGRAVTEFTFQATDPLVNKGQQEARNPNIITNRICDQLTNVCAANAAAKTACAAAKAQISALGTKDVTTADAWNSALGFAGAETNPDGAPKAGLVGHD